jgi:hypothetical protein
MPLERLLLAAAGWQAAADPSDTAGDLEVAATA